MLNATASPMNGTNGKRAILFDSLEIEQYRAFQHLKLDHLGGVNLIVGKNSVGKSCLIEAVRLFVEAGSPAILPQLVEARDKTYNYNLRSQRERKYELDSELFLLVKNLFHGRRDLLDNPEPIHIILTSSTESNPLLL